VGEHDRFAATLGTLDLGRDGPFVTD